MFPTEDLIGFGAFLFVALAFLAFAAALDYTAAKRRRRYEPRAMRRARLVNRR